MDNIRSIEQVRPSQPTFEGAGVRLRRAFGFGKLNELDPFLLLDEFRSNNPEDYRKGFPWHPHRGIETITYMLQGEVVHGDSMGNSGVIAAGDVQWMTAGSGIVHQEMPKGRDDGAMWGFQLWANLPAKHKMMDPRYREVKADQIPVVSRANGVVIRLICGVVDGMRGPVQDIVTDPAYLDVSLPPESSLNHPISADHNVFAYLFEGQVYGDGARDRLIGAGNLIFFGAGDTVEITTTGTAARLLLVSGKPLGEPVAWYGPIVMNTQEELELAFREYQQGTFLKRQINR
jgi:quercetin 2,3-dioxygenase